MTTNRSPHSGEDPDPVGARIAQIGGWRGETLRRIRALIRQAVPGVVEELKWGGTPVWSHHGIICTGESYQKVVKMTFAKGASLPDPSQMFNSSLDGKVRRAIDVREDEPLDEAVLRALFRAAAALNAATPRR